MQLPYKSLLNTLRNLSLGSRCTFSPGYTSLVPAVGVLSLDAGYSDEDSITCSLSKVFELDQIVFTDSEGARIGSITGAGATSLIDQWGP